MPAGDYLAGLSFAALVFGCALAGALLLVRARLDHLAGVNRLVAGAMVASLGLLAIHLVPATAGVLTRGTAAATAVLWLGVAILVRRASAASSLVRGDRSPVQPASGRRSSPGPAEADAVGERPATVVALVGAGLLALTAVAIARDQALLSPIAVDMLNFHLPGVAAWIQSGSIWQIDVFLADVAPGHYPNNGDILLLAAILPWHNDFLVNVAMQPFWVLTGVAVYALAAELRVGRSIAIVAGCLVVAIPAVAVPALVNSMVDAVMLFGFATGLLFLVRHQRDGRTAELVLAGLALGLSFGTKWYGVSVVAIVVAVWVAARLAAGRRPSEVARQGAALVGLVVLAGGIWLLRNLVESGNPFVPVEVAPFGVALFEAPRDIVREKFGATIADYIGNGQVWVDAILPQYRDALALPGAILLAGLAAAVIALLVGRRRGAKKEVTSKKSGRHGERTGRRGLVWAGLACAAAILLAYSITPYTAAGLENAPILVGADSRYAIPALVVAAGVGAWVVSRLRRGALALSVLALVAIADGVRLAAGGELGAARPSASDWLFAAVVLAAVTAGAWLAPRAWARLRPKARVPVLVSLVALCLAGAALLGYEMQKRYNGGRFVGFEPAIDRLLAEAAGGHRIGLVGLWDVNGLAPVYPAFGPRLRNEVEFVGRRVQDVPRRYRGAGNLLAAVRSGNYDYVIAGRGRTPQPALREELWLRDAGFEPLAESERLVLLRPPPTWRSEASHG